MISQLEIWMLGIALAMDCFSVSTSAALAARRLLRLPMAMMTLSFGLFQGGMTLIGYLGATTFSQAISDYADWIAAALLGYIGGKMIWESLHEEEGEEASARMFSPRQILILSVATSIDALAVGISFACIAEEGFSILMPVLIIGICSSAFTVLGLALGLMLGKRINWNAELLGGIVLVGIGIKILIEHFS